MWHVHGYCRRDGGGALSRAGRGTGWYRSGDTLRGRASECRDWRQHRRQRCLPDGHGAGRRGLHGRALAGDVTSYGAGRPARGRPGQPRALATRPGTPGWPYRAGTRRWRGDNGAGDGGGRRLVDDVRGSRGNPALHCLQRVRGSQRRQPHGRRSRRLFLFHPAHRPHPAPRRPRRHAPRQTRQRGGRRAGQVRREAAWRSAGGPPRGEGVVSTEEAFARVEAGVRALRAGRMAVVRDDAARENEGDLVLAAELATANALALMARLGGGLICAPITAARAAALGLDLVSSTNTTPTGTAFLTPVDVVGCTTGISAAERAATARALAKPTTHPDDLLRPGHLFPLQAHEDGLRARQGHTEAAVELARLAGLAPAGVICEGLGADGAPLRGEALEAFAARHGLPLLAVADLVAYLDAGQGPVRRGAAATLPTQHGVFQAMVYREVAPGAEHLALVAGTPRRPPAPMVSLNSDG